MGNATPEAEQGLNVARLISLMSLDTDKVSWNDGEQVLRVGVGKQLPSRQQKFMRVSLIVSIAGGVEKYEPVAYGWLAHCFQTLM